MPSPYDMVFGQSDPSLAYARSSFAPQLDEETISRLFQLTHNEVGSQGYPAQQAFMESVLNRAAARNQPLPDIISDKNYFPSASFKPVNLPPQQIDQYHSVLNSVLGGSNVSNYATGNASGSVGFGGGPMTASYGGEKFGIEKPDLGWGGYQNSQWQNYQSTPQYLTSEATGQGSMSTIGQYNDVLKRDQALKDAGSVVSSQFNKAGQQIAQGTGMNPLSLLHNQPIQIPQTNTNELQQLLAQYLGGNF